MFSGQLQEDDPELAQILVDCIGNYLVVLTGIIAAGISEGEIRSTLSPRETALSFLGMIQITALRWTMSGASFNIKEEADSLWRNSLRMIG
jgi:hypothetical protein